MSTASRLFKILASRLVIKVDSMALLIEQGDWLFTVPLDLDAAVTILRLVLEFTWIARICWVTTRRERFTFIECHGRL